MSGSGNRFYSKTFGGGSESVSATAIDSAGAVWHDIISELSNDRSKLLRLGLRYQYRGCNAHWSLTIAWLGL